MAFASLLAIPARLNISFFFDSYVGNANGVEVDFSPTLANGAKFDLSAASTYTVVFDNGAAPGSVSYVEQVVPSPLLTAGLTGGSLELADTSLTAVMAAMALAGAPNGGKASILASDGTHTVVVAVGTWSVSRVP
jgi:hypothetical protein